MRVSKVFISATLALAVAMTASTAYPQGKGNGKGNGGGGNEDPPAEPFVPAIAYFEETQKTKDLRLSNRSGDQACLILQSRSGEPKLMGFVYHAGTKRLAYSRTGVGIQIATWDTDPCDVVSGPPIPDTGIHEFMDFSPDGSLLAWSEGDPDYTGFGSSYIIIIYDVETGARYPLNLKQWGGSRPEWGVNGEWSAGSVKFSPDFEATNEIIFSGAPLDASQGAYNSVFAYDINEQTPPRRLYDPGSDVIGPFMSVTNPTGIGIAKVAVHLRDQRIIKQIPIADGSVGPTINGAEPAYSCDNSEIIHHSPTGRGGKNEIRITSSDGSTSEFWSKASLRFFDWFCP